MAYLAKEGLKHWTIKAYLSVENQMDPFQQVMNRLHYVLWGIKQTESEEQKHVEHSVNKSAKKNQTSMGGDGISPDAPMLWAACMLPDILWISKVERNGDPRVSL